MFLSRLGVDLYWDIPEFFRRGDFCGYRSFSLPEYEFGIYR
ncbi:hypothetical protein NY055_04435 [Corynebacterium diphtheriae bv. mitis]|nr:hypothetical protein NY055_04435 [Corynebacterium diphtheriae bv. mitis]